MTLRAVPEADRRPSEECRFAIPGFDCVMPPVSGRWECANHMWWGAWDPELDEWLPVGGIAYCVDCGRRTARVLPSEGDAPMHFSCLAVRRLGFDPEERRRQSVRAPVPVPRTATGSVVAPMGAYARRARA